MSRFVLKEISGDLFSADASYSLAHCISADIKLGKGIAVMFRDKFGQLHKLQEQKVQPGGVAILQDGQRYIYNLVTKQKYWNKPTYQTMHSAIGDMRQHMLKNNICKLAIPRIGCGLDGLQWPKVKDQLQEIFNEDSIEIIVYNYTK